MIQPPDYFSLNPPFQFGSYRENTRNRVVRPYVDVGPAPPLTLNTLFRTQTQIPLPMKPQSYNYNVGYTSGVTAFAPSLGGAVPLQGTVLTKIGTENFKVLEPINLYTNLKLRC